MALKKLDYFRIYTKSPGFVLRDLTREPRYAKILKEAEEFKLPELARGVYAIPEYYHNTKSKMLNEKTIVAKAEMDELGTLETSDPYVAKKVMDILKNLKRTPVLDKACRDPEEVIAELEATSPEEEETTKKKQK